MSLTPINIPTSSPVPLNFVPFSVTPKFSFSPGVPRVLAMVLAGNVTSSTIDTSNLPAGALVIFMLVQDATGNRTFAWPAGFQGAQPIAAGPGQTTMQSFTFTGKTFNANGVPQVF